MNADAALELDGLSIAFGGVRAVQNVSLRCAVGERRTVIGPNGAGKTTLFNLIAGQLRPDRGRVRVHGRDVTDRPPFQRARAGLSRTFQISRLFRGLTVRESLAIAVEGRDGLRWASFRRRAAEPARAARIDALLGTWGLDGFAAAPIEAISHGNQRLLDIAMALANEPQVLLLDEPTAGLSGSERELVAQRLRNLPRSVTIVMTDHDMDVVFDFADRITVLNYGEVAAEGPPAQIRDDPLVQQLYFE
jgi:ABC-type branched-subunit amino acid transport system ATPase component